MPRSRLMVHDLINTVGAAISVPTTGPTIETFGHDGNTCHMQVYLLAGTFTAALQGRLDSTYEWVNLVTGITASGLQKDVAMLPEMRINVSAAAAAQVRIGIVEG